jgi:hypothetical protein
MSDTGSKTGFITPANQGQGTMLLLDLPSDLLSKILLSLASTGKPAPLVRMGMVNRELHLRVSADRELWRTYWTAWLDGMRPPLLPNNLRRPERISPMEVDYEVMLIRKVAEVQMRHDAQLRLRRKRIQEDRLE